MQTGSVLINFDLPFNPAILHQRIGRIYRLHSEHDTVRVVALVARDTIEERVLSILSEKGDLFAEVVADDGVAELTHRIGKISDSKWAEML
jgi:SNF2 family DNA or RNA helicase